MRRYLYDRFENTNEYKQELIEHIRRMANVEVGGYRQFDGTRTHIVQSPWELADFIFLLKAHEEKTGKRLTSFLEIGFSSGLTNTLLHKFFQFERIVAVDNFSSEINTGTLKASLIFKPIRLICGDAEDKRTIADVEKFVPFDLIFIDACHTYEAVKADFHNYIRFLAHDGIMALHDIAYPIHGVRQFWKELKESGKWKQTELVCNGYFFTYGIGVLRRGVNA